MFLQLAKRGDNAWWRYLLTILLVVIAYILGQFPLLLAVVQALRDQHDGSFDQAMLVEALSKLNFQALGMDLNYAFFLMLLMFVFAFVALWFCLRQFHDRSLRSLITAQRKVDWSKIGFAFSLWFGVSLLLEVASYYYDSSNYIYQLDWSTFLPLLAITVLILPIQTSFEELFVRGYLLQGMALLAPYRWIPLVLSSVLFGIVHGMNPEVEAFGAGIMLSYYIGIGLFLGIITLMDDSLELALGIHAATNIYGALMLSYEGAVLQTPAMFRLKTVYIDLMIPSLIVLSLFFLYIFAKKYQWKDWRKIFGPVDLVNAEETSESLEDKRI